MPTFGSIQKTPGLRKVRKMDFTPVIASIWDTLGWLILLMLLIALLNLPWTKGHIDERLSHPFRHWPRNIHGRISIEKLRLENAFAQTKRWQATVGRSALQTTYSAAAEQKAKREVAIIISSHITPNIGLYASRVGIFIAHDKLLFNLTKYSDARTAYDIQNSKILQHSLQQQTNIKKTEISKKLTGTHIVLNTN